MTEQEKYEAMWARPEYRKGSPGERIAPDFVAWTGVTKDDEVIDFGCGSGRGAKRIHQLVGCKLRLLDFADNCRDDDVRSAEWAVFQVADLSKPIEVRGNLGFCTDVMEHIPPEQVDDVIRNIMEAAERVFFQISTVQDSFGKLLGKGVHLHLTVEPYRWWVNKFRKLDFVVERSEERPGVGIFLVRRAS